MNNWEKGQNGLKGLLSAGVPNSIFGNSRKPNYRPTTLMDNGTQHLGKEIASA